MLAREVVGMTLLIRSLLALCTLTLLPSAALAQACDTHSGLPVPRFVSLKFEEVNGRAGPSRGHPVRWLYERRGLPVEVIAETADWRQVRDIDGEETWMHRRTLSGRRAVSAIEEVFLQARPEADGAEEARVEAGAILWLERCRQGWCRLEAEGRRGWAPAGMFWGVYPWERTGQALEAGRTPCYRSDEDVVAVAGETSTR
ncbi:MAG: SH3 domain-containing protein [Pseudomonadota bacterium]